MGLKPSEGRAEWITDIGRGNGRNVHTRTKPLKENGLAETPVKENYRNPGHMLHTIYIYTHK